ncbi:hypothetical protein [Moraxella osloensis]|uniref:hypothetical protein n=1 Tax=Faucicola osloensis TaxID=34062 RepID=UPI0015E0B520|nr:hypothetical protein [Moraxella osloensis]
MNDTNNWQKLAEYLTNLLAETHAIYLQNNGINVQTQLVDLMGLNTGGVLWVAPEDVEQAKALLDNIDDTSQLADDDLVDHNDSAKLQ